MPSLNFISSGTLGLWRVLTCGPHTHTLFKASRQREPGSPPFLCPSITVPFIMISPFLCSIICPHRFLPHLYPHLPVSPGPHALSACLLPPSVSLLCHRLLSSLLGLWPRCLPGHPPWLPLCGSELAPPSTPPSGQASDPPRRSGARHKAPGAKDRLQPLSTHRGAPGRGHGGGLP